MALKRKISLKQKPSKMAEVSEVNYPSLYIRDVDLPLDGDNIGKTLNTNAVLKFVGMSKRKNDITYDFEVRSITFIDKF